MDLFVDWSRDPEDDDPAEGEADTVGQPCAQPVIVDEVHEVTG